MDKEILESYRDSLLIGEIISVNYSQLEAVPDFEGSESVPISYDIRLHNRNDILYNVVCDTNEIFNEGDLVLVALVSGYAIIVRKLHFDIDNYGRLHSEVPKIKNTEKLYGNNQSYIYFGENGEVTLVIKNIDPETGDHIPVTMKSGGIIDQDMTTLKEVLFSFSSDNFDIKFTKEGSVLLKLFETLFTGRLFKIIVRRFIRFVSDRLEIKNRITELITTKLGIFVNQDIEEVDDNSLKIKIKNNFDIINENGDKLSIESNKITISLKNGGHVTIENGIVKIDGTLVEIGDALGFVINSQTVCPFTGSPLVPMQTKVKV